MSEISENNTNNNIDDDTSCTIKFVLGGVFVLWILNWCFCYYNIDDIGSFGDQFGAVNALFTGLAFAGTIYALLLQKKSIDIQQQELEAQREELKQTREEFKKQTEIFEEEKKTQELQRFENTFFMLMTQFQKTVSDLHVEFKPYNITIQYKEDGKACFEFWYRKRFCNSERCGFLEYINNNGIDGIINSYNYIIFIDYFGYLCSILQHIDYGVKSKIIEEENRYVPFLINILSPYELVAIFYYGLSLKGRNEIKGLLEKYHVLCHLNPKDLGYSFEIDKKNIQTNFLTNLEPIGTDFDYYVTDEECYANNYRESAFIKPEII